MSETGTQQSTRYCGALLWRDRWTVTPSLYRTQSATSSQCKSACRICDTSTVLLKTGKCLSFDRPTVRIQRKVQHKGEIRHHVVRWTVGDTESPRNYDDGRRLASINMSSRAQLITSPVLALLSTAGHVHPSTISSAQSLLLRLMQCACYPSRVVSLSLIKVRRTCTTGIN